MNATSRQAVVWLVNEGGHDFSPASSYGRLMPVTIGNVNTHNLDRLAVLIAPRLKAADATDFIVMSGSPILNAIFLHMWLTKFGQATILLYHDRVYRPTTIYSQALNRLALGEELTT